MDFGYNGQNLAVYNWEFFEILKVVQLYRD
jgi:hypothetical protein